MNFVSNLAQNGLTTEIGGKKLKFPEGTVVLASFTNANLDKERFPNPMLNLFTCFGIFPIT